MRVAYLGPPGTFSEAAVTCCELVRGADRVPLPTFADAYEAALGGETEAAVLPIENSIEGSIDATLDLLAHRPGVLIRREILLPVEHHLMAARGTTLESVTRVLSHPQALGQCAAFLRRRLPGIPTEASHSTAEAARKVAESPGCAAIGPATSADRYGLEILARSIQDSEGNTTRFVLLMRDDEAPTGSDKTSIAFTLDRDHPGGLYEVLGEFARRGINLSRIASRPTRRAMGHYIFFVDFEGHRLDPSGSEALEGVRSRVHSLHVLGSYPRVEPSQERRPRALTWTASTGYPRAPMTFRALRGAITVTEDSESAIVEATRELITALLEENGLVPSSVISAFFTCTQDLRAAFPARAARELGFESTALLCATEIDVPGALPRCIRTLMHVETERRQDEVRHVYLREARKLRPEFARDSGKGR